MVASVKIQLLNLISLKLSGIVVLTDVGVSIGGASHVEVFFLSERVVHIDAG